jgi:hypothetical protein
VVGDMPTCLKEVDGLEPSIPIPTPDGWHFILGSLTTLQWIRLFMRYFILMWPRVLMPNMWGCTDRRKDFGRTIDKAKDLMEDAKKQGLKSYNQTSSLDSLSAVSDKQNNDYGEKYLAVIDACNNNSGYK